MPPPVDADPRWPVTRVPTRLGHLAVVDRPAAQDSGTTEEGDGPVRTLLLLHGLPTTKELWFDVVQRLPTTWRLLIPDLPDFGESDPTARRHDHRDRAGALRDVVRALGIERFDLVGHDLGASVAVQFVGDWGTEQVRRLSLLSAPVYPDFRRPTRVVFFSLPVVGELVAPVAKRTVLPRTIREGMVHPDRLGPPFEDALASWVSGRRGSSSLLRTLRWGFPRQSFRAYPEVLRGLDRPTLVIHGRQDPWIPLEHADRLAQDIPDCRLEWVEDGGHFLPIDTPEQVAELLADFHG